MKVIVKAPCDSENEIYLIPLEKEEAFERWMKAMGLSHEYWEKHWRDFDAYRFEFNYANSRLILDLAELPEKDE